MSLRGSLEVDVARPEARFVYRVENVNVEAIPLTFRTGQLFDIRVMPADETTPCWVASEGQLFTMAIEHHTLEPGDEWTFEASTSDLAQGSYEAVADLAAEEASATARTSFEIA